MLRLFSSTIILHPYEMPKPSKARTVNYTLMAGTGPGRLRKSGSALSLLCSIPYFFLSEVIPPIGVVNEVLKQGVVDAGMSGGCRWKPFQLSVEEYAHLVGELQELKFADIAPPDWVKSRSDWHSWCCEITWGIPALEYKRRWEEISSYDHRREKLGKKNAEEASALLSHITDLTISLQRWMNEHRCSKPKLPLFRPSRVQEHLS